ncbi:hypothetical protein BdWA1_000970 [Babesia duncani]|uniref:Uncharacterized protein n=1 Tax=Babesia duncani TaxID=323732 RepID=A0AAD9UQF1_9APIC|nr:hypothetical protein BdWA1_000970 [Babesia duncani]
MGRKHINAKVEYYQRLVRERFFQPQGTNFGVNMQRPFPPMGYNPGQPFIPPGPPGPPIGMGPGFRPPLVTGGGIPAPPKIVTANAAANITTAPRGFS